MWVHWDSCCQPIRMMNCCNFKKLKINQSLLQKNALKTTVLNKYDKRSLENLLIDICVKNLVFILDVIESYLDKSWKNNRLTVNKYFKTWSPQSRRESVWIYYIFHIITKTAISKHNNYGLSQPEARRYGCDDCATRPSSRARCRWRRSSSRWCWLRSAPDNLGFFLSTDRHVDHFYRWLTELIDRLSRFHRIQLLVQWRVVFQWSLFYRRSFPILTTGRLHTVS